jgi:hypothetical protein
MIKPFNAAGSRYTPEIQLDKGKGVFLISGISLAENTYYLYEDAIKWLLEYAKDPNDETIFEIDLEYMNSSSVLNIARVIKVLSDMYQSGKKVIVKWYYKENDLEIQEHGEELEHLFNLPVELIQR